MFRKIVSNLPFSPALVGQLSFYAKRLRKEEATRKAGLIVTALALIVQSFAVFSPPEAANASSNADFVRGGVSSVQDFLRYYDENYNHIRSVYDSLGITRAEIASARPEVINNGSRYNWSMTSLYSYADGQRAWNYGSGSVYYRPMRLTQESDVSGGRHNVFAAYSKTQGWFAIKKDCGNLITEKPPVAPPSPPKPVPPQPKPTAACSALAIDVSDRTLIALSGNATTSGGATISQYTFTVTDKTTAKVVKTARVLTDKTSASPPSFTLSTPGNYSVTLTVSTSVGQVSGPDCVKPLTIAKPAVCAYNPALPQNSPDCQPCPGNTQLWIKDKECKATIIDSKTATNITQGNIAANTKVAQAGDRISYTITAENQGNAPDKITFTESLHDVLEYSQLIDAGGGVFDQASETLQWPQISVAPKSKEMRTFIIQVKDPIPLTNTGTSDPASFDCVMTNTFGNTVNINVACPPEKQAVEQTVSQLPHTGPRENMIFAGVILSIVVYFYARTRQLGKEVRLVRRNVNSGTI